MAHQNYKYKYTNDRNRRYLLNIEHNSKFKNIQNNFIDYLKSTFCKLNFKF